MPSTPSSSDDLQQRLQASLGDAYRIERELAPGGMSRLFLATEASLNRQVVIKLLPPETANEVSAARFQREVLLAAHLQHPHILPVLTTGSTTDGVFYYIMPYVAGESLRHRLARPERLPIPEAVRVLREIADALAMAHERGIVHRDIKPANILLQAGHAVVTDFGIARAIEASRMDVADRLTAPGTGIGTVGYMAPEQLAGERNLNARADVYALAVVGYEMLAGQPPFSRPTAQELVTAHLSEPPPPLSTVAPEVPPEIAAVIAKALSKAPKDRYPSAAEFRDALDLQITAAFAAVPRSRPRTRRRVIIAATVLVAVAAAGIYFATHRAPALDRNSVVVLPFNVRGADTTLRQGLVDIIYEGIKGQGWVKSVPPSTYLRNWSEKADESTAAQLGKRTGAALAVFGSVEPFGADSLTVNATIVDVARGRQLGVRIARRGAKENLSSLGGDIVKAVLKELDKWKPLGAFRTTWIEEANPTALQAFLIAEQFYRRSAWDSAMVYYGRAIEADSTFALAHHHAGLVVAWRRSTADSISRVYLQTAGRFNHGLPKRDSIIISADSVRAALDARDPIYLESVRRLFATLRTARDSFPTDPQIWFALGDAYFHFGSGPTLSVDDDTMLTAFDRTIQLDSGFTPAYIHAIELRLARDGGEAGLRYAQQYLSLEPSDEEADGIRALVSVLRDGGVSDRAGKILDTLSSGALQTAWLIARRWPDSAETGVRLLQLPMTGRRGDASLLTNPGYRRVLLVAELAYRGRLQDAYATLGTNVGTLEAEAFGVLAVFGTVPSDSAAAVFARWLHDPSMWVGSALPWWAAKRDTTSLLAAVTKGDGELQKATTLARRRQWTYRTSAARAYLSLGRRGADALSRFQELPDTLCMTCYLDRYTKAKLFDSLGRHDEAERALQERPYTILGTLEVRAAWERAIVAEKLQHYVAAARAYSLVARAWSAGDPPQREIAAQAAKKAGQLGGDQQRPAKLASSSP